MAQKEEKQIKVLRSFLYDGKPVKPGKTLTVDKNFAAEMVSAQKAEYVSASAAVDPVDDDKKSK